MTVGCARLRTCPWQRKAGPRAPPHATARRDRYARPREAFAPNGQAAGGIARALQSGQVRKANSNPESGPSLCSSMSWPLLFVLIGFSERSTFASVGGLLPSHPTFDNMRPVGT